MILKVCKSVLIITMLLLRENILGKLFCRTTDFFFFLINIYIQKSENAIFDCINDSNVRFIKDIMLILYRKVCMERRP